MLKLVEKVQLLQNNAADKEHADKNITENHNTSEVRTIWQRCRPDNIVGSVWPSS